MHQSAFDFVKTTIDNMDPIDSCVEFGGQDVNESNQELLIRNLIGSATYVSVDIFPGRGVDIVADAADWRTDIKYDLVICCETLEHTSRGAEIIESAFLALNPGGHLILTCATDPRAVHGAATDMPQPEEYYGNVSLVEIEQWLADWDSCQIEVHPQGDLYVHATKPVLS